MSNTSVIPIERIEKAIYLIRGEKVMLDRDLALLYGVETKMLNRAVKRNLKRFPSDFMFQLTADEADILRYQIGTSDRGGSWQKILCFVDKQAEHRFKNKSWLAAAVHEFGIKLRCVNLPPEIRAKIFKAQERQVMVNR